MPTRWQNMDRSLANIETHLLSPSDQNLAVACKVSAKIFCTTPMNNARKEITRVQMFPLKQWMFFCKLLNKGKLIFACSSPNPISNLTKNGSKQFRNDLYRAQIHFQRQRKKKHRSQHSIWPSISQAFTSFTIYLQQLKRNPFQISLIIYKDFQDVAIRTVIHQELQLWQFGVGPLKLTWGLLQSLLDLNS